MGTGVDDAVTERDLNDIVRDGIKNQFVRVSVCYNLYRDNPIMLPGATPSLLWHLRSYFIQTKRIRPLLRSKIRTDYQLLPLPLPRILPMPFLINKVNSKTRDKLTLPETTPEDSRSKKGPVGSGSGNFNPLSGSVTPGETPDRCTRCWQPDSHSYKVCAEVKCASCGRSLQPGQKSFASTTTIIHLP